MFYPTGVVQALAVLIFGLCSGGSWPAVRQIVKHVDYTIFNLAFVPAMSFGGLLILALLSLPRPRSPPPPSSGGPGDPYNLINAFDTETTGHTSRGLVLATLAGACVATSNFLLCSAMSYAGLTRTLPVFNGMAILVGVSVNVILEGNSHLHSLVVGVLCIFAAIFLTFLSRQQQEQPLSGSLTASSEAQELELGRGASSPSFLVPSSVFNNSSSTNESKPLTQKKKSKSLGHVLSFVKLSHALDTYHEDSTTQGTGDESGLASCGGGGRGGGGGGQAHRGYAAVGDGGGVGRGGRSLELPSTGSSPLAARAKGVERVVEGGEDQNLQSVAAGAEAKEEEEEEGEEPVEQVVRGLALSAVAGCVDGCWSSLTLEAKLLGVDNYVTASYFCLGLLIPLAPIELFMYCRDPRDFTERLKRTTTCEWLLAALAGVLNIAAIITYFMATVVISSAVAFAIFLSTPLVSIALGVFVVREMDDEPFEKKLLVAAIITLYVVAIAALASNALAPALLDSL
mmetsp:Transcript_54725/g.108610  ORF Transcript_54725/g.108610 Transcript_54725/m.108610 type:complete len:513 (-) Transcript_54725:226-1764(-)